MSLIVARTSETAVYLVSDTKLSPSNDDTLRATNDYVYDFELKIFIIDDRRCMAYAGNSELAYDATKQINSELNNDEITELLVKSVNEGNGEVDYLFCLLDPSPLITRITQESGIEHGSTSWIGSPNAFHIYQSYFLAHETHHPQSTTPYFTFSITPVNTTLRDDERLLKSKLSKSMENLISSTQEPSVGGARISLSTDEEGFKFDDYSSNTCIPEFILRREVFSQGSPYGDGGQNSNNIVVTSVSRHQLAIHVLGAKLGVTFKRSESALPSKEVYHEVSSKVFWKEVRDNMGAITGVTSNEQAIDFFKIAWFELQCGKYSKATELFNEGISSSSQGWGGYSLNPENCFTSLKTYSESTGNELNIPYTGKKELQLAFFHRGYSLMRQGHLREAEKDFNDSLTIDNSFKPAIHLLLLLNNKFTELKKANAD